MKIDATQKELFEALKEFVIPWRKLTIVIDGITGSGKSTLGRYLSWKLDMPLIETDMYRVMEDEPPAYRYSEIANVKEYFASYKPKIKANYALSTDFINCM